MQQPAATERSSKRSVDLDREQWDGLERIREELHTRSLNQVLRWAVRFALDHYPSWPTPR